MKKYDYRTKGTCSTMIHFELDDNGIIHNCSFENGCNGNLKAISKLVEGKSKDEIINILKGNTCRSNSTSCADQLARALEQAN